MSVHIIETTVHFTVLDDGTHLAAAVEGVDLGDGDTSPIPCFAVSGATLEEAKQRAQEILVFHAKRADGAARSEKFAELGKKLTRTVRPFLPSHTEKFQTETCAA